MGGGKECDVVVKIRGKECDVVVKIRGKDSLNLNCAVDFFQLSNMGIQY